MRSCPGVLPLFLGVLLAGCSQPPAPPAEKVQPLDTSEQKAPVADPSQPVASGNTPAAADIAAVAALNAQFDPARDPVADLETAKVEARRGGKRAASMYSLLITAKLNGHEPLAYFSDVLQRLPTTLMRDIDELLPWNWQPSTTVDAAAALAASSLLDPDRIVSAH